MSSEPTEAELLRRAIENRLLDLHTSLPAIVDTYYDGAQTIDAKLCLKRAIASDTEKTLFEELPLLRNIRVKFPKGRDNSGHRFFVSWPLNKGDPVDLIFDEQYAGQYRDTSTVPSEPLFAGRFNLSSCYAIPGGGADSDALSGPNQRSMFLGAEGGPNLIEITFSGDPPEPKIFLAGQDSAVARASDIAQIFNTIIAALASANSSSTVTEVGFKGFATAIASAFSSPILELDIGSAVVKLT